LEKSTGFSEKYAASIFRVEEYALQEKRVKHVAIVALLDTCFTRVSCKAYFSTLKMEEIFSSKISVDFQQTTRLHIPESKALHSHRCEKLKSHLINFH
jgi:hypothetical protein